MKPIRVMIAHQHCLMRLALGSLISSQEGFLSIDSLALSDSVVTAVCCGDVDVLLIDGCLEERDCLDVVQALGKFEVKTRVMVLTQTKFWYAASRFLKAGAQGCFAIEESEPEEVFKAIRKLYRGGVYISPEIMEHLLIQPFVGLDKVRDLSEREVQVLCQLASGKTTQEIARCLCISPRTVESHRGNTLRKIGLRNNVDAARYAIRTGLVQA